MDQDKFDVFYKNSLDAICGTILPQMDRETAERLIEMILVEWSA
jgi:hypothetical protein